MSQLILNQLTTLISDKDFQALSTRCLSKSILEKLKFDENKKSDILSWLLNPSEGHLQKEYFVRALLNYVYNNASEHQLAIMPEAHEIISSSLSNLSVTRELRIEVANQSKFIDLVLFEPNLKLLILLERKDGTKAHTGQLGYYANWVEKHYSDWNKIFILSDSQNKDHGEQHDNRYVQIDDTWLNDALLDLIGRGGLLNRLENQLKDIHDFIFGEWEEKRDPYYKGFYDKLKLLANNHQDVVRTLEGKTLSIKKRIYSYIEITPSLYFSEILPSKKNELSDTDLKVLNLIQQHNNVFEELHGISGFEQLKDDIERIYSQLAFCVESNALSFTCRVHDVDEDEWWPYYIQILQVENEQSETQYEVSVVFDRDSNEKFHSLCRKVAEKYDIKLIKNWRFKQKNIIEPITCLSLTSMSQLRLIIDEFIVKVESATKNLM
ncbi:PD-(D/E)XK nuclease family protein [Pseudoalteromonas spongiae]|uniref:PD-(D/E)XK nuclease family protein n=1 Tax=Pseudoalteromonas spongiae TaxID=298657 RepID=A0ABU8ES59_9GAMM